MNNQKKKRFYWNKESLDKLRELKNQGLFNKEIAEKLSTSEYSVDNACSKFRILLSPKERKKKLIQASQKAKLTLVPRYKKRGEIRKFDSNLGYIVGVILGDGSTTNRGNHGSIQLKTTNKSFADIFFKALKDYGFQPKYHIRKYNKVFKKENRVYNGVIYHEVFYNSIYFLNNIIKIFGLTNTKKWKINVEYVLHLGNEFCKSLIRGLFDSEGCFWTGKNNKRALEFSSTNKEGSESLFLLLTKLGFDFRLNKVKRDGFYEYKIRTTKISNIKKFYDEIGFGVDYKQEKLKDFLKGIKQERTVSA